MNSKKQYVNPKAAETLRLKEKEDEKTQSEKE